MTVPTKKRKKCSKYSRKGFLDPESQGIFISSRPKNFKNSLLCIPCGRSILIEQQGKFDSQRHCLGKSQIIMLKAKRSQGRIDAHFVT